MSKRYWAATATALTLGACAWAQAADDEQLAPHGFYLGAGLTQSRYDGRGFNLDHNTDNNVKGIVGYRFSDHFAAEANYIDFGSVHAPAQTPATYPFNVKAKGYSAYAVGLVPLRWGDVYGKLGAARVDSDGARSGLLFSDNTTRIAYGAGVQVRFAQFAVRAEYEKYTTRRVGDLDVITLGATYTFGSNP
jgi:hypothetical protein